MALPSALRVLPERPARSAVLTDFDGTLAAIVDDPATSVPLPGMVAALDRLAESYAVVGVVSGRPLSFLAEHLGPGVQLSGLYGLERRRDGRRVEVPEVEPWRERVAEATARAQAALGPVVEPKGLSLTLHFRVAPERADEIGEWAEAEAARSGLKLHRARASIELHPPLDIDKGTEVEVLARGMKAVCFFGDDLGDVAAFGALDRLAATGVHTVRVAVLSDESPPELVERADVVVEGPAGVLEVLEHLAGDAESG